MEDNKRLDLDKVKENYDSIKIPDNINDYIMKGIKRAKKSKRISLIKVYSSIAAVLTLVILLTSIRMSPAFASYISNIPGMESIVRVINSDKGLKSAVEHGLLQDVETWDEHEGIKLTIEKIIADDSRMVIFYAIENNSDYDNLRLTGVDFKDSEGDNLYMSYTYGSDMGRGEGIIKGKIDMSLNENSTIPEEIFMDAKFATKIRDIGANHDNEVEKILDSTWQLKFSLDKEKHKYEKLAYNLNQSIEIEGQKIEFIEVVIHPTRTELTVNYDPSNTKKILGFDDLKLVDGDGLEYGPLTNTIIASHIDDNTIKLYMESSYFSSSKELYIKGGSIRAVDRDDLRIVVNLKEKKLVAGPDKNLIFEDISFRSVDNTLEIRLKQQMDENPEYNKIFRTSFGNARYGEMEKSTRTGVSYRENSWLIYVSLELDDILADTEIIEFDIIDYPARIKKDFSVRIR